MTLRYHKRQRSKLLNLIRVRAFTPPELANDLSRSVEVSRRNLRRRFSPGTIRRLGGSATSIEGYTTRLVAEDRSERVGNSDGRVYAVIPEAEREDGIEIIGLATVIYGLNAHKQRLPVAPALNRHLPEWLAGKTVNLATANITAWTRPEYDEYIGDVYKLALGDIAGVSAWTVEPIRSEDRFHIAIMDAGMIALGQHARYDVGENVRIIPPVSEAYVRAA
jgi:hypothetical protein